VYRLQVGDIPNTEGLELYPTIEMVDRTYPPARLRLRYPVSIDLTQEELELASRGAFVTRIIYIEEPNQAMPIARKTSDELPWMEAPKGEDPLVTADRLGRPVAILRIGGRVPIANSECDSWAPPLPPAKPTPRLKQRTKCCRSRRTVQSSSLSRDDGRRPSS
jgi:hypothetical protein